MSDEMKDAYKAEAKAAIAKVTFWTTAIYRIGIGICVGVTLMIVNAGKSSVVDTYSDFKELKKDRDEDKRAHIVQSGIDRYQDSCISVLSKNMLQAQADITCNRNEIVKLKIR